MNINENDKNFDADFLELRISIVSLLAGRASEDAIAEAKKQMTVIDPALRVVQRVVSALERIADAQEIRNRQ